TVKVSSPKRRRKPTNAVSSTRWSGSATTPWSASRCRSRATASSSASATCRSVTVAPIGCRTVSCIAGPPVGGSGAEDRADEGQPVAQRDEHLLDAGVGGDRGVELRDRGGGVGGPSGRAVHQRAAHADQPVLGEQLPVEHGVEVVQGTGRGAVDEHEVEHLARGG